MVMGWDRDDPANRPDLPHERRALEQERADRMAEYAAAAGVCVLAGKDGHRCNTGLQWHHPVKQQRIKRAFPHGALRVDGRWVAASRFAPVRANAENLRTLRTLLADPRNRIWACWDAHQQIEGRVEELPESVWEFAREFGLDAQLENDLARRAA